MKQRDLDGEHEATARHTRAARRGLHASELNTGRQAVLRAPLLLPQCLAVLLILELTASCQLAITIPASSPAGIPENGHPTGGVVLRGKRELRPVELLQCTEVPGTRLPGTDASGTEVGHTEDEKADTRKPHTEVGESEMTGMEVREVANEGMVGTETRPIQVPERRALGGSMRGGGDPAAHWHRQNPKHKDGGRALHEESRVGVTTPQTSLTAPSPPPTATAEAPAPPSPRPASGGALLPEATESTPSNLPSSSSGLYSGSQSSGSQHDSGSEAASGSRGPVAKASDSASGGAPPPVAVAPQEQPAQPEEWRPQQGKFLLAFCLFGRMTNQLLCMRYYLTAARLTNRALLVPTWGVAADLRSKVDYTFPWDVPVDWARMARCLEPGYGNETVMTVKEYLGLYGKVRLNVSNFRGLQGDRNWAWRGGGGKVTKEFRRLNFAELDIPDLEGVPLTGWLQHIPRVLTPADVAALGAGIHDDVISFGELFYGFLDHDRHHHSHPHRHLAPLKVPDPSCSNLWRPHPGIMEFVRGVQRVKIGGAYGALHFRRGDFYYYLSGSGRVKVTEQRFPSAVGLATEVRAWLQERNMTRLFVATNARLLELDLFKAVVADPIDNFKLDSVVTLRDILMDPDWLQQQSWAQAALALDHMEGIGGLIWSIADKYLCVYADHFWGAPRSSFSQEIDQMLRKYEPQSERKHG